jgi:hypothetical protein
MAYARLRRPDDAVRALARAAVAADWRPANANEADVWMYHLLRREAEDTVLPNLPQLLAGRGQPRNNNERMAMTAACQFRELNASEARLWEDAFAADPSLETHGGRDRAVPAAVLAGCGQGSDASALPEEDRRRWRARARDWFRAEVDVAAASPASREDVWRQEQARAILKSWRNRQELAAVRDPEALERLPDAERREWSDLWQRVARTLDASPQPR